MSDFPEGFIVERSSEVPEAPKPKYENKTWDTEFCGVRAEYYSRFNTWEIQIEPEGYDEPVACSVDETLQLIGILQEAVIYCKERQ